MILILCIHSIVKEKFLTFQNFSVMTHTLLGRVVRWEYCEEMKKLGLKVMELLGLSQVVGRSHCRDLFVSVGVIFYVYTHK